MTDTHLHIIIASQRLHLVVGGVINNSYHISTGKNGSGQTFGSGCTPIGWHKIAAKIGNGQPTGAVFVHRRPTGEIYNQQLAKSHPDRDWILTRILWLAGTQAHKNRYGTVDSASRYIYIHGCPDGGITGKPTSGGCVRMHNADLLDLYGRVTAGCRVLIE